ncbi:MAG: hypothetical protein NTZ43_00360 [Gemmatimonadetes bacterium]|nr:hypothetical protein [Gemmatimonadota bacterium]
MSYVKRLITATIIASAAGRFATLNAQAPSQILVPDTATTAPHAIADMKLALRNLVVVQEKYWADHGSYTTDGKALGLYPHPKGTLYPQVIQAGSRGWSGMVTFHPALKGKSCTIWVGASGVVGDKPKTMGGLDAGREGEPICDAP